MGFALLRRAHVPVVHQMDHLQRSQGPGKRQKPGRRLLVGGNFERWLTFAGGPGAMARVAHAAAAPDRTCQAPWYCHRLSGRHSGDPERPAA
jgi:hypothetical protein